MTPEDVAVAIARHDQRLLIAEKGVSNFRDFQGLVREFISEQRAVRKEREEAEAEAAKLAKERETKMEARRKEVRANRIAITSIILVALLPPSSWIGVKAVGLAGEAWDQYKEIHQIVLEWESVHKSEIQKKKTSSVDDPAYSMNKNQTADLPSAYQPR